MSQLGHRKVTSALWGTLDEYIITGHDNGELVQWDTKVSLFVFLQFSIYPCIFQTNEQKRQEKPHTGQIMDLQTDKDLTFLISSSKDCTAQVEVQY